MQGAKTGPVSISDHTGQELLEPGQASAHALCSVPVPGQPQGQAEMEPGPGETVVRSSRSSSRDRDFGGGATVFPSISRTGSSRWRWQRLLRRAVTAAAFITHHQTAISSPASSLITQPAFSSRFITGINNEFRAWKAIKMCD